MSTDQIAEAAGDGESVASERASILAGEYGDVLAGATPETAATEPVGRLARRSGRWLLRAAPIVAIVAIAGVAGFLRFWQLTRIGFNSDEAVYTGTAASIAGDPLMRTMFPVFRAHPLLFQMLLAIAGHGHAPTEWTARAVPAAIGVLTVLVTYLVAARMYQRNAGLLAAAILAVMPYHVVVSRQVLLDGLMTLAATVVLYCVVRYTESASLRWLLTASAVMGVSVLAKETSLVLLGGLYAYFALTPTIRMRFGHLLSGLLAFAVSVAPIPIVLWLAGRAVTGRNYLLWQVVRRGNHGFGFYFQVLPSAVGPAVLLAALAGLILLVRERTWRERLLVCWAAVPLAFFTLWPVKGYQYLLPVAPVVAVLAGRALSRLSTVAIPRPSSARRWVLRALAAGMTAMTLASLAVPTWAVVNPAPTGKFLAGTGGVPGGREAGRWVLQNVPPGAQLLAIGPSMANVLQFYGQRRVYALSVSPNPRYRNPSYTPVPNPDRSVREGQFQYLVWDSYTAHRATFFADQTRRLVDKYHGVAVYTGTQRVLTGGHLVDQPVIVIYEVRT